MDQVQELARLLKLLQQFLVGAKADRLRREAKVKPYKSNTSLENTVIYVWLPFGGQHGGSPVIVDSVETSVLSRQLRLRTSIKIHEDCGSTILCVTCFWMSGESNMGCRYSQDRCTFIHSSNTSDTRFSVSDQLFSTKTCESLTKESGKQQEATHRPLNSLSERLFEG